MADLKRSNELVFETVEDAIQYFEKHKSEIIAEIMQMPDTKKRTNAIAFLKAANIEGGEFEEVASGYPAPEEK